MLLMCSHNIIYHDTFEYNVNMLTLAPVSSSLIQFLPSDSLSLLNCLFIFNEHFKKHCPQLFKYSLPVIYIHKTKLSQSLM